MNKAILRGFRDTDAPWLVQQHGEIYAREEGFDAGFGPLMAGIVAIFWPNTIRLASAVGLLNTTGSNWAAYSALPTRRKPPNCVCFLLTPNARGQGLGKRLLANCMDFAKTSGYRDMVLWTHESHRAACALYTQFGWELVASEPVHSFGVDLIEQSWRVDL